VTPLLPKSKIGPKSLLIGRGEFIFNLVSPSGMVETPRLQAKFLFAIGLITLSLLPPCLPAGLMGEGWEGGDEGSSLSTPTPAYRQAGFPSPISSGGGDFRSS
jgi:hypothetical protein